jgi:hypothetical protein
MWLKGSEVQDFGYHDGIWVTKYLSALGLWGAFAPAGGTRGGGNE